MKIESTRTALYVIAPV